MAIAFAGGYARSSGGFNDTNLTVLYRWRVPTFTGLQASACVVSIGGQTTGGGHAMARVGSATNQWRVNVYDANGQYQGDAGGWTPVVTAGDWNTGAFRWTGTTIKQWHNGAVVAEIVRAGRSTVTGRDLLFCQSQGLNGDHRGDLEVADVAVCHLALTDDEVLGYMRGISPELFLGRTIAFYPAVGYDGSPIRDARGYRDLTVNGSGTAKAAHPRVIPARSPSLRAVRTVPSVVTRYAPDAILARSNLNAGAAVGTLQAADGSWLTAVDPTLETSVRVSFPTPS